MSKIEWTDKTWNPITGCTKVSPGCKNCYAERMAKRLAGRFGYPESPNTFDVTLHEDKLTQPLSWRKPRKVFVCSMGDLFHDDVSFAIIDKIVAIMALCPQHVFQVLTKRPERALRYFADYPARENVEAEMSTTFAWETSTIFHCPPPVAYNEVVGVSSLVASGAPVLEEGISIRWPLSNVWIGTSIENQKYARERLHFLLRIPAKVRFLSLEPLLGPVDLNDLWAGGKMPGPIDGSYVPSIHWVIVGAETGPSARYMNPDWARSIRDQCKEAGVPFFMKQMSFKKEIPGNLFIREFPNQGG